MSRKIIYARRAAWGRTIDIVAGLETAEGIRPYRTTTELLEVGSYPEPLLSLEMAESQALMDQLWDCGVRPSEGSGSAGALLATQKHLADMRALVFDREKP